MMPAGKYYIGDLCYVMHDKWGAFCNLTIGDDNGCLDGEMRLETPTRSILLATYSTAYGDGEYLDDEGRNYPVDAGLIGCIKVDDIHPDELKNLSKGHVVEFDQPFHTGSDGKVISFGDVYIDTDPRFYEEEEDYEDDYADEEEVE